ncbi:MULTISPECIES: phosphoribosylformylglycinamidine cyclo-ligase [Dehalobacter]|jgi:phosphoribosylformylglycinamidine cyclo-ligase|uniref:Phosphoribosylformylglycinamidine cyclo-ligase n=1 Tax=Dehalobacter restrictus (strain DSM 9455 / PER-K23) TaxID=871738 RepID=A0ABM5P4J3_DEHRP|nr:MULTISPECIES: phosphoribosylformylglycinamidine cyclo-ligase [Dehalobacter]AHF09524.1 phosphoribosylaminoimidazole synthetase [Dehalobacter restrictus DSM 9455]MCG1025570.1 phosphoribosylformylglycinamidine cyclo-ligase [Dehalobacter sp.]MDJ0306298.1 phosphoribosylformylglycinamidine cyclo-ligase [Dehalobacter sp.]OCZ54871.1 phosphoribosylformylglycinamidine cyclo-ligase [Dehalobacter sp. TeCB1]
MGITYKDAGVDIQAGNEAVEKIKPAVAATWRPGVLGGLGGFGGLFSLDLQKYSDPVLVSGTDGVGTKLRLAFQLDKHDTIGQDAVAMCVNDVLVQGAEPLFFLDYLAVGKLVPERIASIVGGVAEGCRLAGCALIGGETAEMPGFYAEEEYDIAGFAVGAVNRDKLIDGSDIREGDILLGLKSSGLHSNGFSLVRKIFAEYPLDKVFPELGRPLGEVLITPTRIYVKSVLALLDKIAVPGMVHITGGGLTENIPRVLSSGLGTEIVTSTWQVPPVFELMQKLGNVEDEEMLRTFNMGIGFVLIIHPEDEKQAMDILAANGEEPIRIGSVISGQGVSYR